MLAGSCQQDEQLQVSKDAITAKIEAIHQFKEVLHRYNQGGLNMREELRYTLDSAMWLIEGTFIYVYGDYDKVSEHTISITDTISISYSELPMTTNEAGSFAEQVRQNGSAYFSAIDDDEKFFYTVDMAVISADNSTATIQVNHLFGTSQRQVTYNSNPTPNFSISTPLYAGDYGTCADPNNILVYGAPLRLASDINYYIPMYQMWPIGGNVVFTDIIAEEVREQGPTSTSFKVWWQAKNPNDSILGDCYKDWNVYKHFMRTTNCHYTINSTCIDNNHYHHYGTGIWNKAIDYKSEVNRNLLFECSILRNYFNLEFGGDIHWRGIFKYCNFHYDDTKFTNKLDYPTQI